MKIMKILLVITVLTFQIGCSSDDTDHLRIKYHLLKFNHSVDQIVDIAGTPDIKLPEVIGKTWI